MRSTLASLVDDFHRRSDEVAVVAHRGNRRYATTYGELALLAGRFSAELSARGIAPAERVVLWGENSVEWIACFFGCVLCGVIAVPLDAAGSVEFATRVMQDVAPRLIVGEASLLRSISTEAAPRALRLSFAELRSTIAREPLFTVSEEVKEQTPLQIVFTSGTTSEPKGIVHTHRNVLVTLEPIEREMQRYLRYERWVHPLRFLHTVPLSHVFGQFMGLWIPPLLGAEVHFSEGMEASRMVEIIHRERISVLIAVPRVLQLLRAHLLARFPGLAEEVGTAEEMKIAQRWWRFRRVHHALGWRFWALISGGATLPPDVEGFWNRLGFALIQGYGMTETSALVTLNHPFQIKQGTIGKPLPGREVKITDEGEILVRGAMLAEATWQRGEMHAREGEWLATGDLAERSESGELRFVGRKGDVIVTAAGMNVHPADLEAAMLRQPGVRGCAVVACELPSGTEPVAVVIFCGSDDEMRTAVDAANRGLAEFQQMRRVLRWPELAFPYTSTGKLLRRQIAVWACARAGGGDGGSIPDSGGDLLLGLIAEVTGEARGRARDESGDALRLSEDLHLDSLGRVQLQTLIEQKFATELDEDEISNVKTVGELRLLMERSVGLDQPLSGADSGGRSVGDQSSDANAAPLEADRYPRWPWRWPMQAVRVVFLEMVVRPLVFLLAAPKVVRDEVTYPEGPLLIVANHVTAYDGALILYALPSSLRRHVAAAMSGEMLLDLRKGRRQGNRLLDLLAPLGYALATALFNVFPLPRVRGFRRSFAHAGEAMDRGYSVLVFPEGTRTRDGRMHAFRAGIGLLAKESNVDVLPVALVGLGALRAENARWFRSGRLGIRVGKVIRLGEAEEAGEIAHRLETEVRELLGEKDNK